MPHTRLLSWRGGHFSSSRPPGNQAAFSPGTKTRGTGLRTERGEDRGGKEQPEGTAPLRVRERRRVTGLGVPSNMRAGNGHRLGSLWDHQGAHRGDQLWSAAPSLQTHVTGRTFSRLKVSQPTRGQLGHSYNRETPHTGWKNAAPKPFSHPRLQLPLPLS